ncbi:histidine kinase-like ATPase [Ochromonadaceae sp. CCMP2298]|nr:histidine kinase-like ATPase [Ochromonadaceae sp. CCMP2298]
MTHIGRSGRESEEQRVVLDTKKKFVRFISHEIRTPLNSVRLGLKLFDVELVAGVKALATASPTEALRMVGEMMQSWIQLTDNCLSNTEAAVDVLSDLLNYDKIESGTMRLEFSPVRLWDEEKEAFESLHVVGDAGCISQLLRNIVSNALKFTPKSGTVTLQVDWHIEGLPYCRIDIADNDISLGLIYNPRAGSVRVSVTDTGAGLSPEQLGQICGEGVQFNANLLQAGQGSGLGLFISKGMTKQHGGTLTVTSAGLGCGDTFTVELSLFEINVNVENDAALNRKLLTRILKLKGYECTEAEDGLVAIEKYEAAVARGEPFDAILCDYEMPVVNGPTCVQKMRGLGCSCFIVGVTGNIMQIDFFKDHGADTVLAKVSEFAMSVKMDAESCTWLASVQVYNV